MYTILCNISNGADANTPQPPHGKLATAHLHADDQADEAKDPAEEQQRDDGEHNVVRRLNLHEHSALYWSRLGHYHVVVRGSTIPWAGRLGRRGSAAIMT